MMLGGLATGTFSNQLVDRAGECIHSSQSPQTTAAPSPSMLKPLGQYRYCTSEDERKKRRAASQKKYYSSKKNMTAEVTDVLQQVTMERDAEIVERDRAISATDAAMVERDAAVCALDGALAMFKGAIEFCSTRENSKLLLVACFGDHTKTFK